MHTNVLEHHFVLGCRRCNGVMQRSSRHLKTEKEIEFSPIHVSLVYEAFIINFTDRLLCVSEFYFECLRTTVTATTFALQFDAGAASNPNSLSDQHQQPHAKGV